MNLLDFNLSLMDVIMTLVAAFAVIMFVILPIMQIKGKAKQADSLIIYYCLATFVLIAVDRVDLYSKIKTLQVVKEDVESQLKRKEIDFYRENYFPAFKIVKDMHGFNYCHNNNKELCLEFEKQLVEDVKNKFKGA